MNADNWWDELPISSFSGEWYAPDVVTSKVMSARIGGLTPQALRLRFSEERAGL
jgi:hypothetical protein